MRKAMRLLALLAGSVLFIRLCLVVVTIQSHSMSPALMPGDRVLVLRRWPGRWLRKGQIVLVWPFAEKESAPGEPFGVIPFIKRIVGMPGDLIASQLADLDEIHRAGLERFHDREGKRSWEVPPGHCFLRGDRAPGGFDSLSWGPVPFGNVLGIVLMKLPQREGQMSEDEQAGTAQPEGLA